MPIKEFKVKVIEKKQLTRDVILLSVTSPEDFTFKAGQYCFFMIEDGERNIPKAYSILSSPSDKDKLDFCIKIVDGGTASETFIKTKVGDIFTLKGPLGHFVFDGMSKNKECWFIGVGTGITPFFPMINENLVKYPYHKFVLLCSFKYKENVLFFKELNRLTKENKNFTYIPSLTREEWEGKTGRVQTHLPEDYQNKTFYICGLKELVEDMKDILLKKGVKKEDIKFEMYS